MEQIRILYMGTPELSSYVLEGLILAGFNIVGLVSQEDKPIGRNRKIEMVPTKKVATKYGIPCFQPHKIRLDYSFISDLKPDLIVTCAYGQILPNELLSIPRLGCINVHGSLLPKYRGASPIQQSLLNGDSKTGVTIIEMIDKMDAGDMLLQKEFNLSIDDNYTSTSQKIAECGLDCLKQIIPLIVLHQEKRVKQNEDEVTYCKKITKEEEHLDLTKSSKDVINQIRALSETPGGFVYLDEQIFKIYQAKLLEGNGKNNTIIKADKNGLWIGRNDGIISLEIVQKQGKKKMDYKSFVNGEKNLIGKEVK